MTAKLLRLPEVINRTGRGRSAIYEDIAEKKFPKQIKIGPRASAWLESDVQGWIDQRIAVSQATASEAA